MKLTSICKNSNQVEFALDSFPRRLNDQFSDKNREDTVDLSSKWDSEKKINVITGAPNSTESIVHDFDCVILEIM